MPSTTANSTSGTGAAGAAITPSLSSLTVGNQVVLLVGHNSATAVPTPTGWTAVPSTANTQNPSGTTSDRSIAAFTKLVASATETASLTTSGAYQWTMFEVANTSGPTASSGNTGAVTTAGANPTTNSGAGVATNDLIIAYVMTMTTASTFTAGTGYTVIPTSAPSTANLSSRAETKSATGSGATAAAFVNASTTLWSELVFSMAPAVFAKQATETATAAETPGRVFAGTRNDTSTVNVISDTPGRVQALLRGVSETALASDVVAKVKALFRQGTETSLVTDSDRTGLTYEQQVLLDSPLVFYRFDLETGPSDISGNGRHAVYVGGASNNSSSPIRDEHGSIYTSNVIIATYAGGTGLPSGAAARSIETWIRVPSGSVFPQSPVIYGSGAGTSCSLRFGNATSIGFYDGNNASTWIVPSVTDDIWHYYVLTYDGSTTLELFIDGASQGTKTPPGSAALSTTLATLSLGGDGDNLDPGYLGNVAIYSGVLSADRIIRHYRAGISLTRAILRDQPLAYWRLGDTVATAGDSIVDASGNGVTASYTGTGVSGQAGAPIDEGTTSFLFSNAAVGTASAATFPSGNAARSIECVFNLSIGYPGAVWPQGLWDYRGSSSGYFCLRPVTPNDLRLEGTYAGGAQNVDWAVPNYNDGGWHHLVVTWDGSTAHLYLDGADYGGQSLSPFTTLVSGSFSIGAHGSDGWNGYAQELAICNKALTAKQVQDRWVTMSGSPVMRWIEAPSEAPAITDVPGRIAVMIRSLTETVLTSGAVSGPRALLRVATDALSALDSVARSFVGSRSDSETSTTADTPTRLQTLLRSMLDTALGTDAAGRVFGGSRQVVETASASDTVSRAAASLRAALEATTTTDAANRSLATARQATDTETVSDAATRVAACLRAALDTATSTDTDAAVRALLRQTDEQVSVLDSAIRALALGRSSTETEVVSDTDDRLLASVRSSLETIATSDIVDRALSMTREDADSVSTSDAPNRIVAALRQGVETVVASEAVRRILEIARTNDEAATSEDVPVGQRGLLRQTADIATALDSSLRSLILRRSSDETGTTADNADRSAGYARTDTDSTSASDSPNRILAALRQAATTILTSDAVAAIKGGSSTAWTAAVTETTSVVASVSRLFAGRRQTDETQAIADSPNRLYGALRATLETLTSQDAATRHLDAIRAAVGNATVVAVAQRSVGRIAAVTEAIISSDAAERIRGVFVTAAETSGMTDASDRIGGWIRSALESIGISDVVSAIYHRFVSPGRIDIAITQPSTIILALSTPSSIRPSLTAPSTIAVLAKRPSTIEITLRPL